MEIFIIATQNCSHCKNLKRDLSDLGIGHVVYAAEDHPELVDQYKIRHSPNLVVDGEVVFRRQPTKAELKELLQIQ